MTQSSVRAGYTLPVFATASAVAALCRLKSPQTPISSVTLELIDPPQTAEIPVEQVALLKSATALAITRSDPGDNLDMTRDTPVWALVELQQGIASVGDPITILGGEGIGRHASTDQPAVYAYAQHLLKTNLSRHLEANEQLTVTIILPAGRQLAQRTSNEAFGIVEGLSLLGTTGLSQPLSAPEQLDIYSQQLRVAAQTFDTLVFCIGENGRHLAQTMGIHPDQLIKTANWLGPMLVTAGMAKLSSLLLFGYHGKLIKLAGGIFHTHHFLADARLEILTAISAKIGVPVQHLQNILQQPTAEDALHYLRTLDQTQNSDWANQVYCEIAQTIDQRTQNYIRNHAETELQVGSILFDRRRQIIVKSTQAASILTKVC